MAKDKQTKNAEIVLKLKKAEFFDSMVLLPHSEINAAVYEAVERFAERQDPGLECS
ncbi:MAG: hypothetical protein IJ048_04215 [Clostridia bacterium]|nr:hypothetical protein [Clostridia bacterium]